MKAVAKLHIYELNSDLNALFLMLPKSKRHLYELNSAKNALLWMLPKPKHHVPIENVVCIDDISVHELVVADDREQLHMAEIQGRRLQQEVLKRSRQEAKQVRYASNNALRISSRGLS